MKLDLNSMIEGFNKLSDQMRYGILGGVAFLIIALDVFFLVLPQMASTSDLNDQIKKANDDIEMVQTHKLQTKPLKKKLQEVRDQFQALNEKLRTLQEVPVILSDISSIANENGVKIDQLVPQKDLQETIKTTLTDGKYYALPIVMKAHCGYHMFGRFLSRLENEKMYFLVNDFIVQNDDKDMKVRSFALTIKLILVDRTQELKK